MLSTANIRGSRGQGFEGSSETKKDIAEKNMEERQPWIILESLFTTTICLCVTCLRATHRQARRQAFFAQMLKGKRLKEKHLAFSSHCSVLAAWPFWDALYVLWFCFHSDCWIPE